MSDGGSKDRRGALQMALSRYLGRLPTGASKSVRLSWSRRISLRLDLLSLPLLMAAVIFINVTWLDVLLGVWVVFSGVSLALLTRDIRRARRAERAEIDATKPPR
jgi:Flp pilus assembly protein TadB